MLQILKAYTQVIPFIHKNRIWSFYWLPILFNLSLLILLYFVLSLNIESILNWVSSLFFDEGIDLNSWLILSLKVFIYILGVYYLYQPLSLIFLAPLFSILSENIQDCLNNKKTKFSVKQFWVDVKRGIKIGFRNVIIQFPILMVLFMLGVLIPILLPFTMMISFFVTSYFYGFTMIDYRNEYYKLNPNESRVYVNFNFIQSLTIGAVFNFLLYIPILGTLLGPSLALSAAALSTDN